MSTESQSDSGVEGHGVSPSASFGALVAEKQQLAVRKNVVEDAIKGQAALFVQKLLDDDGIGVGVSGVEVGEDGGLVLFVELPFRLSNGRTVAFAMSSCASEGVVIDRPGRGFRLNVSSKSFDRVMAGDLNVDSGGEAASLVGGVAKGVAAKISDASESGDGLWG